MRDILATLSRYPIKTRLALTGPMIVARDLAHAKLRERLEKGQGLPDYFNNHPGYYAGPAKTTAGYPLGPVGPTPAGATESFVGLFPKTPAPYVESPNAHRPPPPTPAPHHL